MTIKKQTFFFIFLKSALIVLAKKLRASHRDFPILLFHETWFFGPPYVYVFNIIFVRKFCNTSDSNKTMLSLALRIQDFSPTFSTQ